MDNDQLVLPFDAPFTASDIPELWTPREIWVRINEDILQNFHEDSRIEYKSTPKIDFDALATYYSAFSNTPDGGVLAFGIADDRNLIGCSNLSQSQINKLESFHLQKCPEARPEFKRIPIRNGADFLIFIYLPYRSRLVETHKCEAWMRVADSKHKMSEEEKRDYRSTRTEVSFELDVANYKYPDDFEKNVITDFCEKFRSKENQTRWSDEEILIDRRLLKRENGILRPLNSLVLIAAKDVGQSIPGCRVRVQRFPDKTEGSGESYQPIRDKVAEGNIVKIIQTASTHIEDALHNVTWLNNEGKFVTTPEYPKWAWFEALVNACIHRSYSYSGTDISIKIFPDRMIIESPGGFVPPVNEKTIYSMRASRNHHTMDALRFLGYVQMAREGTRRIRDSMASYNLPEPEFRQETVHGVAVRVTLTNDHETQKRSSDGDVARYFGVDKWKLLQEHEIKIAAYTYRNAQIQVSEAQRITGRTWSTSKKDLERLCRKGLLKFVPGEYTRDPRAYYTLAEVDENSSI